MAETPLHYRVIAMMLRMLQAFYGTRPEVYVSGNMMVYYIPNNKRDYISPDVMVALNAREDPDRDAYFTWEDGPLSWVLEVTSKSTRRKDTGRKFEIYAQMGVEEYFLYDPRAEYLRPPLQGYRLVNGRYLPIPLDDQGRLTSTTLGIQMAIVGRLPQLFVTATGERILDPEDAERARADTASLRAETERARADAEHQRAEGLAAEVAELRRQLAQMPRPNGTSQPPDPQQ